MEGGREMSNPNCPFCGAPAGYHAVDGTKKYDCGALVTPEIVRFCKGVRRKSPHDEGKPTALVHKALYDTVERERDEEREAIRALAEHGESEIQRITKERDEVQEQRDCLHNLHNKNAIRSKELLDLCRTLRKERDEARAITKEAITGLYNLGDYDLANQLSSKLEGPK
jgi:hypothetical protein